MADPPRDDAALLQRFQTTQDEAAFGELVRRHGPLVWGVCRRRLERLEDAEDAFQTTFLILAIKAGTIRRPEALAGWLHRTATRVARRVATKAPPKPGDEQHDAGLDALAEITKREMIAAVDDELQALPGQYRDVLVLFHLEGLPRQEVASRLGVSEPTIKARLSRGRSLLRSRLARRGVALPLLLPLATDPLPAGAAESATRLGTTFGRTRVTPGDLLTTTLSQGAHPMLSLITGKTGLAVLAVCLGLTVVWAVRDPLRAGDEEGRGVPVIEVIDTALEAPAQTNDSLLTLVDKGDEVTAIDEETKASGTNTNQTERSGTKITNADHLKTSATKSSLKPAEPIRLNVEERKILADLASTTRIEYAGIPLRDALTNLALQHDIQIVFDQAAIEEANLSLDNNVDLFLKEITLGSILNLMLEPEGLTYQVEDEVLKITARDALASQVDTRAYYIPPADDAQASAELTERLSKLLMAGRRYRLHREPEPGKHPMDREPEQAAPVAPVPVIEIFGDRLIIAGTLEDHKNLQDMLRLIYGPSEESHAAISLPRNAEVQLKLNQLIPRLSYSGGIPLEDALENLSHQFGFDLKIDEASIKATDLSVENGVDLEMEHITLRSALNLLLEPEKLGFAVEEGVVHVLPSENHVARSLQTVTKLYPAKNFAIGDDPKKFANKIEQQLQSMHKPIKIATSVGHVAALMPQAANVAVVDDYVVVVGTASDQDQVGEMMADSESSK